MRVFSLGALALAACHRAPAPLVRAEPALQVVGESTKLTADQAFPQNSPFFDGKAISVRMARGETVGLQLLFRGTQKVTGQIEDQRISVELSQIEMVDVTSPSTAMYGPSRGVGRYPDRLHQLDSSTPTAGPVLLELSALHDAPAGEYDGAVTVGAKTLALHVYVRPIDVDIASHPHVWAYYDRREIGEQATACAAMFRTHGVLATPELTLDNEADNRAITDGSAFIPVLLPDDEAGVTATVKGWIDRLAGRDQIAFAIPVDEPHSAEEKAHVKQLATWARAAGAGDKFLYAVTDAPDEAFDGQVDLFISPLAVKREPHTKNRWTYNGKPPQAGSMILDTDGVALRTWGWIAFRWQVPEWYVWDALYWHDRHNRKHKHLDPMGGAPIASTVTFDDGDDHGNLDGVLAYPAKSGCEPSLRLKALRRGLYDRALLDRLAQCGGAEQAEAIAVAMVPTALGDAPKTGAASWSSDESAWEDAREQLLGAIVARCPATPPSKK